MKAATKSKNNPNKVNQYTAPDPRQALFIEYYFTRESPTFSNTLQSALAAGYAQEYAESLTAQMPKWLSDFINELDLLKRAERNISEILDLEPLVQAMGAFGPLFEKKLQVYYVGKGKNRKRKTKMGKGAPIMVINPKLLKIKQDTSHFIAERLGKMKYLKPSASVPKLPPGEPPKKLDFDEDRKAFA